MSPVSRSVTTAVTALALLPGALHAQRLMELEGIQLRGSARVVAYGAATCEIREGFAGDDKVQDPANRGQPLDVWQLDFSVYNGSGKWLDHLIARYNIESEWPPCSSWDGPRAGAVGGFVEWGNAAGFIQESGRNVVEPGQTLTTTSYLVVFHRDEPPRFERWSLDYDFATSPPAGESESGSAETVQDPGLAQAPAPVPGESDRVSSGALDPNQTCAGKEVDTSCWMEIENQPGCYLWVRSLWPEETASWTGKCAGGLAQGVASLIRSYTDIDGKPATSTGAGEVRDGKRHGQWTTRFADGRVHEGSYVYGKRHGQWTLRGDGGRTYYADVATGPYVDGKMHGLWTAQFDDGGSLEECFFQGELVDSGYPGEVPCP